MRSYVDGYIGGHIGSFARFFDQVIHVYLESHDQGPGKEMTVNGQARKLLIHGTNFNSSYNIQDDLERLVKKLDRHDRLCIVMYNSKLSFFHRLSAFLSQSKGSGPKVFLCTQDLDRLARLTGLELISVQNLMFVPFPLWGLGNLLNELITLIPFLNRLSLLNVCVLRPVKATPNPSLSVIIPARNEAGNIENILKRLPNLGPMMEVIFVEGNSEDGTWEEINRVIGIEEYKEKFQLKAYKQPGKGKHDAVRTGLEKATNELLAILDADLTMPPERLPQFYRAYADGKADFINGSRLVYPMEGKAMDPLSLCVNKIFAKVLSWLLDLNLGDSLCGTKVITRADYERLVKWREDFGDYDPFGDFDLLFAASVLKLSVVDIPIRYSARTYGKSQINRFRDGVFLVKMVKQGLLRIKLPSFCSFLEGKCP